MTGLEKYKSCLLGSLVVLAQLCFAGEGHDIYVGETKFISDPTVSDVVVGSDSVLLAKPVVGKGIALTGIAAGDTTVKIWRGRTMSSIDVHVSPRNLKRIKQQLIDYLGGVSGIGVEVLGDYVVVTGAALSKLDKAKVDGVLVAFPGTINLTSAIDSGNGLLQQMVYLDVKIVELSTSNVKELGIKWNGAGIAGPRAAILADAYKSDTFTDPFNPLAVSETVSAYPQIKSLQGYLGIAAFIDSKINLMEDKGIAKIVARPTLSCKNGGKASFLSGGQIPYQGVGATGTPSIEFKEYGIKLDIQPTITTDGIMASMMAEVSTIDKSVAVGQVPGLLTRRTDTEFVVAEGQTIVLSGLVSTTDSKADSQLPGLGRIPVLGWLFKDRSRSSQKTELLMFVTPYLYEGNKSKQLSDMVNAAELIRNEEHTNNVLILPSAKSNRKDALKHPQREAYVFPTVEKVPSNVQALPTVGAVAKAPLQRNDNKVTITNITKATNSELTTLVPSLNSSSAANIKAEVNTKTKETFSANVNEEQPKQTPVILVTPTTATPLSAIDDDNLWFTPTIAK